MSNANTADGGGVRAVDPRFLMRLFYAFAALAVLSVVISVAGKFYGRSIAMAGHTDDATIREVVIGNDVLAVPSNAIRFETARRDGIAERLDLYLHWPDMLGYTAATADDFNRATGDGAILFLRFEPRTMSRDMSGRLEPIYTRMIEHPGKLTDGGVVLYDFTQKSGYVDEVLAVAGYKEKSPFVARCLTGATAAQSFAPCERDLHVGEGLSLTYRFPASLLSGWRSLDAAVLARANGYLRTGR